MSTTRCTDFRVNTGLSVTCVYTVQRPQSRGQSRVHRVAFAQAYRALLDCPWAAEMEDAKLDPEAAERLAIQQADDACPYSLKPSKINALNAVRHAGPN